MQFNIVWLNLQAEEVKINREKREEQEERMARELARINHQSEREKRMRQYIKENRCARTALFTLVHCSMYTGLGLWLRQHVVEQRRFQREEEACSGAGTWTGGSCEAVAQVEQEQRLDGELVEETYLEGPVE